VKGWLEALLDGRCSYDFDHRFAKGDRVFRVRGPAGWEKTYCAACGKQRNGGRDDGPAFPVELPKGPSNVVPFTRPHERELLP
jgi:hypothetical protein